MLVRKFLSATQAFASLADGKGTADRDSGSFGLSAPFTLVGKLPSSALTCTLYVPLLQRLCHWQ